MKAISITEPYASLIRDGIKTIETRSWRTNYRGEILIHASATRIPKAWRENRELMQYVRNVQRGYILCKAELVDCIEMTGEFIASLSDAERATGFYSVGRFAWVLHNVQPINPIPAKGRLGIWEYTQEVQSWQSQERGKSTEDPGTDRAKALSRPCCMTSRTITMVSASSTC